MAARCKSAKVFRLEPGQAATPGKVEATGDAFILVKSIKSLEKNGSHYSDDMDRVMNEDHLLADKFPRITYHLSELVLKEAPKDKDGAYLFDSKGQLAVAGVTNTISMPISVTPLGDKDNKIKINGTTTVKMTDYKIEPPSPKFLPIKTGDDVKLIFECMSLRKRQSRSKGLVARRSGFRQKAGDQSGNAGATVSLQVGTAVKISPVIPLLFDSGFLPKAASATRTESPRNNPGGEN